MENEFNNLKKNSNFVVEIRRVISYTNTQYKNLIAIYYLLLNSEEIIFLSKK